MYTQLLRSVYGLIEESGPAKTVSRVLVLEMYFLSDSYRPRVDSVQNQLKQRISYACDRSETNGFVLASESTASASSIKYNTIYFLSETRKIKYGNSQ